MDKYDEKAAEIARVTYGATGSKPYLRDAVAAFGRECAAEAEERARKAEGDLAASRASHVMSGAAVEKLESQVASLTEKIAGLVAALEKNKDGLEMELQGMRDAGLPTLQSLMLMMLNSTKAALASTAPILDRIKNEAKAEALEESANEMDGGNSCSLDEKNCSNDLCRVVRVLSTRAAALREASK